MAAYLGQLVRGDDPPQRATIQIEDGRCRLWNDRRRIASWDLNEVSAERTGVFRFHITAPDMKFDFQPVDPSGFSDAIKAVVDLRATRSRFGLAERVRQANEAAH
ncbi:MAG TPA: hypothetical protein VIA81_04225 [Acidimicrobiia bacterium]|jgi:hypothetical protein